MTGRSLAASVARAGLVCLVSVYVLVSGVATTSGATSSTGTPRWGLLEETSPLGATLSANSCAGPAFCAALVSNDESTYRTALIIDRNGSWGQPIELPDSLDGAIALSCPTVGTCVVGDSSGRVAMYHDGEWSVDLVSGSGSGSASGSTQSEDGVLAVSCATSSRCVAVDAAGQAITDQNGRWSRPVTVDPGTGVLDAISCPTTQFCVAADGLGRVVTDQNGRWSAPDRIDSNALVAISCGSSQSCIALDVLGDVLTWSGGGWSRPDAIDTRGTTVSSVACATSTLCFAGDSAGRTLRFDGVTWDKPQVHDQIAAGVEFGVPGLVSISCPSVRFCQAVDSTGDAINYG
jgi:hypothetical protein